jgi:hypothetical protein
MPARHWASRAVVIKIVGDKMEDIYYLRKIKLCGNEHGQLRPNTIYAELIDSDDRLIISATLEYILKAIRDRNLSVYGISVIRDVQRGVACSEVLIKSICD